MGKTIMVVAQCDEERSRGHHIRHGETIELRARGPDQCGGEAGGAARPQTRGFMPGGLDGSLTKGLASVNRKRLPERADAGVEWQRGVLGWRNGAGRAVTAAGVPSSRPTRLPKQDSNSPEAD